MIDGSTSGRERWRGGATPCTPAARPEPRPPVVRLALLIAAIFAFAAAAPAFARLRERMSAPPPAAAQVDAPFVAAPDWFVG